MTGFVDKNSAIFTIIGASLARSTHDDDNDYGFLNNASTHYLDPFGFTTCTESTFDYTFDRKLSLWKFYMSESFTMSGKLSTCPKKCNNCVWGYTQSKSVEGSGSLEIGGVFNWGPIAVVPHGGGSEGISYDHDYDSCTGKTHNSGCSTIGGSLGVKVCDPTGGKICIGVSGAVTGKRCFNPDSCSFYKSLTVTVTICPFRRFCHSWNIVQFSSCSNNFCNF